MYLVLRIKDIPDGSLRNPSTIRAKITAQNNSNAMKYQSIANFAAGPSVILHQNQFFPNTITSLFGKNKKPTRSETFRTSRFAKKCKSIAAEPSGSTPRRDRTLLGQKTRVIVRVRTSQKYLRTFWNVSEQEFHKRASKRGGEKLLTAG